MLLSYIRLAWRHLQKNKSYTAINIAGLATGMSIALLIGLWISDELSFDHYYKNHDRIAQALITSSSKDEFYTGTVVAMPMGQAFHDQYKDVFSRTALSCDGGTPLVRAGDKLVGARSLWAQQELPSMFGFQALRGDIEAAKDPSTALISQSLATTLFGTTNPIGQTIKVSNAFPLRVGAVFADLPRNSTWNGIQLVMPWYNGYNNYHNTNTNWADHNGQLYVELAPGVSAGQATARVHLLPTPHFDQFHEETLIYPAERIHLYWGFDHGQPTGSGNIRYVWLFGIIGVFVLLLACINFMNLSTARSEKRAKEVGIRKTVGSLTMDLIVQFLTESTLLAFLSLAIALILTKAALPFFNDLADKDMHIPVSNPLFWLAVGAFALLTGLLAGSYPAFYLSNFKPVKVLKGTFRAGRNASLPRQILVVLQFTVSLTLIIGTIFVYKQVLFTKNRPVGYARQGLLTVSINTDELGKHFEAVRAELLQKGLAENVAGSDMSLTAFNNGDGAEWPGKTPDLNFTSFNKVNVTPEYGRTIGWTILRGRDFSRDFPTDDSAMVINDTAAKQMKVKEPLGLTVTFYGRHFHIIGVAANMVNNNPYERMEPTFFCGGNDIGGFVIRIKPGLATSTALAGMNSVFTKYNPSSPFLPQFVDKEYAKKFGAEERIGNLAAIFTALAIFISCLGLFGLAAFVAEQRTREIGVRKVLGAGIGQLWSLLSKDFIQLTALSMLIAMPLAYWGMHNWLDNYPYHTPLSWWIFAAAGAGIVAITLVTVSFQSLKAAIMNPIKSLRSE